MSRARDAALFTLCWLILTFAILFASPWIAYVLVRLGIQWIRE